MCSGYGRPGRPLRQLRPGTDINAPSQHRRRSGRADPVITLTIQSALPGTLLADGTAIPSPGESVMVKMLNDFPR